MGRRKEGGKRRFPSTSSHPLLLLCILAFPQGEYKKIFRVSINIVEYVKTFTVLVSICKAGLPHAQMEFFTDVFKVPENLLQLEIVIVPNIGNLCNSF